MKEIFIREPSTAGYDISRTSLKSFRDSNALPSNTFDYTGNCYNDLIWLPNKNSILALFPVCLNVITDMFIFVYIIKPYRRFFVEEFTKLLVALKLRNSVTVITISVHSTTDFANNVVNR
uniref:Uncharacterized protein n=1 Tax=Acrobeloides nanus TaxID=290746 RepID=A0A914DXG5_9BILA